MGTVFFLQDLGLDLRMHLSVSWYPWDIDLPRGLCGCYLVSLLPQAQSRRVTFHTNAAGDEGLLPQIRGHLSFHPAFRDWLLWFLFCRLLNQIVLFCPGGTHGWDCQSTPFPGRVHVLASYWGAVYGLCLCLCLEHTAKVASTVCAHAQ